MTFHQRWTLQRYLKNFYARNLVQREESIGVFICETNLSRTSMEWIKQQRGFSSMFAIDSDGSSNALTLLWKNAFNLQLLIHSKRYTDVVVEDNWQWRLTGVYGKPVYWDQLRILETESDLLWLCRGDYNEML